MSFYRNKGIYCVSVKYDDREREIERVTMRDNGGHF